MYKLQSFFVSLLKLKNKTNKADLTFVFMVYILYLSALCRFLMIYGCDDDSFLLISLINNIKLHIIKASHVLNTRPVIFSTISKEIQFVSVYVCIFFALVVHASCSPNSLIIVLLLVAIVSLQFFFQCLNTVKHTLTCI